MGLLKALVEKYPFEIHETGESGKWETLSEAWSDIIREYPYEYNDKNKIDTDIEYTTILGDKITWVSIHGKSSGIKINTKFIY